MKLAGLHIDQFGARSQLSLSDIADQLNVVYGPNGSGKTTMIQFIRWMMFGQRDEMSRRYLGGTPAKGKVTVRDGLGTRTLERNGQSGSMLSQLSFVDGLRRDGLDGLSTGGYTTSTATAEMQIDISNGEFDRFYTLSFDRPRDISDLFNAANSHGFQMRKDQRKLDRVQQLTEQITRHRSELSALQLVTGTVESLRSSREEKRRQIEQERIEYQRRHQELESRRQDASALVADQLSLVERLRSVVGNIDSAINSRKQQLAEEYREWMAARQEAIERRNRRASEIDAQISRWQEILTEVRTRLEQVRARVSSFGEVSVSATESADMHFFLRTLGFRIRDIEQDVTGVYEQDSWRDYEADATYLRGLMGSALNAMRDDVSRLCQTVERQQHVNDLQECREELSYLSRVEQELSDMISALARQRSGLGGTSDFAPHGISVDPHALLDRDNALELASSLNDFRLRHLIERRESAVSRLQESEMELSDRQRQLRQVEEELARLQDTGRIPILEREITEIDAMLRRLEQRAVIERSIASLEDEIRRLNADLGSSEIVDEASAYLRKLTDNEFSTIRLADSYRCEAVRTRDGQVYDYSQLSRGVQDQVYLSVGLAIVAAYRRKQVELPLILNDVFGNLDQSGTRALAALLGELSSRGQQMLVFTRHDHIRRLLEPQQARIFTLMEANGFSPAAQPVVATLPRIVPEPVYVAPPQPTRQPTPPRQAAPPRPVMDELPTVSPDPTYRWVAEWQRPAPVAMPMATPAIAPVKRPAFTTPVDELIELPARDELRTQAVEVDDEPPRSQLQLSSSLSAASTVTEELVSYLASIDVFTVQDLIDVDPAQVEVSLGKHGITTDIVQRRQREVLMLVYLGVTPLEAQLLVTCGVPDPDRLSRADESVLLKRIETVLESPQAVQRFGRSSQYSLASIRGWIDAARRSNYRSRSRRPFRSALSNSSETRNSTRSTRKTTATRSQSSSRKRSDSSFAERSTVKMESPKSGLRFYLELNDPVVDAPSIGPKTAERLNTLDIYTVAQLLDADAEWIATQLDDRRIAVDAVSQWQLQAQLVCRIPNLRGHDAQIIVACGVEEPTTLASLEPGTFLKQVAEFVETKEGQRIIRNGKKPDLAEVTAWIEWSESARTLRAA